MAAAAEATDAPAIAPANISIGVLPAMGLSGFPSDVVVFFLPRRGALSSESDADVAVLLSSIDSSSYPPIVSV